MQLFDNVGRLSFPVLLALALCIPVVGRAADPTCDYTWSLLSMKNRYLYEADWAFFLPRVRYLRDEKARAPYEVKIKDGLVVDYRGEPYHSRYAWQEWAFPTNWISHALGNLIDGPTSVKSMFVISTDGKMYVGRSRVGRFHHSSFMAGQPVWAAGEIRVENGKIVEITDWSGHYQPSRSHMLRFYKWLDERGVDLEGVKGVPANWKRGW